jgi:hypothetical protein
MQNEASSLCVMVTKSIDNDSIIFFYKVQAKRTAGAVLQVQNVRSLMGERCRGAVRDDDNDYDVDRE